MIRMDAYGLTDRGRKRRDNEDQFLIGDMGKIMAIRHTSLREDVSSRVISVDRGHVLLVADGMGGAQAGERASALAVETLVAYLVNVAPWFLTLSTSDDRDFVDELRLALRRCNELVLSESRSHPDRKGMGSTLTLACVLWPRLYVVHAGDSRCYLFRRGELTQLTRDHTMERVLVDQGEIDADKAGHTPLANILTNVLGGDETGVFPEVHRLGMRPGDTVLLATDGLTKHLDDGRIAAELARGGDTVEEICKSLVDGANEAGGSDNVTVVVARFADLPQAGVAAETRELARAV